MRRAAFAVVESLEGRTLFAASLSPDYISYRPSTGKVVLDTNGDHVADRKWFAGAAGDQLVAGDFDGNTVTDLATVRAGLWSIDYNADGTVDKQVRFGDSTQTALAGDVNGDGCADLVVYNKTTGVWAVDINRDGVADTRTIPLFTFGGQAGDIPLLGDINGDSRDDAIIYRNGTWMADYNRDGRSDLTFTISGVGVGAPVLVNWGGDYRVRAGVVVNGQWFIDTDDNRSPDVTFTFGYAGEKPISGFFNTANSIFVAAGKSGTGTVSSPLGKIGDAVARQQPGQIIRVAVGTYAENIVAYKKDDLTIIGAGRNATKVSPASGDGIAIVLGSNTWLQNMRFTGGGRGIISLGGDIHARYISTVGVKQSGIVASDSGSPEVRASTLDLVYCAFDQAQTGYGVWLQGNTNASIRKSTMSGNGTATSGLVLGDPNARGLVVSGNSVATVRKSSMIGNWDNNAAVVDYGRATFIESNFNSSKMATGLMLLSHANVDITSCTFNTNGQVRDPNDLMAGRNGIEMHTDFVGTVNITGSTFRGNTGFGIFIANGTANVRNTVFDNNWVGIGVAGENGHTCTANIYGSLFQVPTGSTYEVGVLAYGPGSHVRLGGTAQADKNTFKNYAWQHAIDISPFSTTKVRQGYPVMPLTTTDNIFVNCPDPIRYE